MPGITIMGSGRHVPGPPVKNDGLARVMDTNDAWIRQRSGIQQRHFAPDGVGASDLALPASLQAIAAAGLEPSDIDYILFNTMTPDYVFPGSGALLGEKLGLPAVPALDLRQQCAAMPFSLQVADGLVATGSARHVLVVGAEAHAGFMPWTDWGALAEDYTGRVSPDAFRAATAHRGVAVLFGDGAGALVVGAAREPGAGLLGVRVHSDGRLHSAIRMEAGGFRRRPFLDAAMLERQEHIPRMEGRELFRSAVQKLPRVIREVCAACDVPLEAVDWFVGHQANDRINRAVREALGVPEERMPSNIARYGNTSSATIPILMDELLRDGRVRRGELVCFFALGAGLHWGAALMRL
jgi:3-oxoacyl-[acyl-carrier-protein] synthase III